MTPMTCGKPGWLRECKIVFLYQVQVLIEPTSRQQDIVVADNDVCISICCRRREDLIEDDELGRKVLTVGDRDMRQGVRDCAWAESCPAVVDVPSPASTELRNRGCCRV